MPEGRYCPEHDRVECTKRSRRAPSGFCHGSAIKGLDACRMHSGLTLEMSKAKGAAFTAFNAMGDSSDTVSPHEVMARVLHVTYLRWALLAAMLGDQAEDDAEATGDQGTAVPGGSGGLIGFTFGPAGITGEAARGLAVLEASERERAVKFAKTAHDMGIAEREIHLAESQASVVVSLINGVLLRLGLSPEQAARVPEAVSVEMRQLQLIPGEVA